jgi:hypothetical protein
VLSLADRLLRDILGCTLQQLEKQWSFGKDGWICFELQLGFEIRRGLIKSMAS